MPPRGHRPIGSTTARRIRAEAVEIPEAAILREKPVVLPYYRSPRARRAEREEVSLEAFAPGRQIHGSPAVAIGIHTTGGLTSYSGTRISEAALDSLVRWSEESSSDA